MAISASQAKALCNASELALVAASNRTQLAALSPAQLRQKVSRARKLRDKWRDQADRQRRAAQTKQGARQTSDSARSAKKAQLFAEVLDRFEKRLAETPGNSTGPAPKKTKTKRVRSAGHRANRAVVRDELDQTRLEMKEAQRAARTKAAAQPKSKSTKPGKPAKPAKPARKVEIPIAVPTQPPHSENLPAPDEVELKPSKKRSIGPVQPKSARSTSQIAAAQGLRVTDRQQLRAAAVAKQNRLKEAGVVRMQMHASSRNRRTQGRRDSR